MTATRINVNRICLFFRFSYFVFVFVFGLVVVEVFMGCNCGLIKTFLIDVILEAY